MRVRFSYFLAFLAGVVVLATAQWLLHSAHHSRPKHPHASARTNTPSKAEPWGELEITPLVLDRPDQFFLTNKWDRVIRWYFPNLSAEQITGVFNAADLTDDQRRSLLDTNRWEALPNGWRVRPPPEVVAEMASAAREKIYSVLAESAENPNQRWPYFTRADGLDEWLEHSRLSDDALQLARRLCYVKFRRVYFADPEIFELLRSPEEARELIQTISRVPTMIMKLRVTPESDIAALLEYWGRFRKGDELDCLLRSMARVPEGASLNVAHFMRAVPQSRIYTYPEPDDERHDCFWTAFNFFRDEPERDLANPADYNQLLRAGFTIVKDKPRFGDLMLLLEGGDTAAHMCVYVAADVVYTKNGIDPKQPWVLMRMQDMMTLYASDKPQQWRAFRKNQS